MTTKRKRDSRRLAWSEDGAGNTLSADLSLLDCGEDHRAIAADLGRGHYLHALSSAGRFVLNDLSHIGEHDHAKLKAWAKRYALPSGDDSWALAWARQSIRLSRGRNWRSPVEGIAGWQVESKSRVWTNTEIAHAAPLVHDAAFQWLARFQLGESYSDLATEYASTASNVRRECVKMAALIDLPLRRVSRGQPKKKRRPAPFE